MFGSFGGDGGVTGGHGGGGVEPWPFEWEPDGCDIDWSLADLPDAYADGAADRVAQTSWRLDQHDPTTNTARNQQHRPSGRLQHENTPTDPDAPPPF